MKSFPLYCSDRYQLKSLTVTPVAPTASTFKAVYDTTGDANTLTFYYDAVDHSGEGITVYEDGTTNYLFDNSKSNGAKWGYNSIRSSVNSVKIDSSVADYKELTSTTSMFQGMDTATDISGAKYLDVSNVTDMSFMFNNFGGDKSGSPTTLNVVPDMSKWNTGNVTNMSGMFESYGNFSSSLDKVPDVNGWNTGNVTNMSGMFTGYGSKSTNISCVLDLSGWDLSKITGTNGVNVFNFNPSTFNVTIPAKTGEKSNEGGKWYYGDGTNSIAPPTGKTFTPANKLLKSSAPAAPATITPVEQDDGTYQFTMPAYAVTVTAEFAPIPKPEEPEPERRSYTTVTIGDRDDKEETKAEEVKEEENPDTGAPVMNLGAIAVVLGVAFVFSKKH